MSETPSPGNSVPPTPSNEGIPSIPPPLAPSETPPPVVEPPVVKDQTAAIAARREASVRFDKMLLILEKAHIPIVLVVAFLLASVAVRNSDFWMHLATGKKIVNGEYKFFGAGNDPFTYGTESLRWVNHSWLYDVLLYALWSIQGGTVIVVIKALVAALLAGLMFLMCRPAKNERIAPGTKANPAGWLAAIFITIAFIAAAQRMQLLQPTMLSFLFLALTVLILLKQSSSSQVWRLPVMLAALFVVWVNCDGWFILGPMAAALYLVGEVLQRVIPNAAQTVDWTRVRNVGIGLAAGLAACLVNPDFHGAFELPVELYAPDVPDALRSDAQFRPMFISPLDGVYRDSAGLGKSPAGIAYAVLLLAAIAAFALNFSHVRWPQLLMAVGFALLSLRNARAIPFFAIVAAPLIVQNLHAWFSRRGERTFEEPEPLTPAPVSAMPVDKGVTLTPARVVAFLGLTGRLLTLALAVAAAGLAYFGKLHTNPYYVTSAQPAAWSAQPDPALVRSVEQLQQWRESGKLPADARGLHLHPEVANYCAWFAPSEKTFMDYRVKFLAFRAQDYAEARTELKKKALGQRLGDIVTQIMRKHDIRYVVASWSSIAEAPDWLELTRDMYFSTSDWTLWQVEGRTSMGGWNGARSKPQLNADFVARAFAPNAKRVSPPTEGRLISGPDGKLQWRTPWENYINPPQPVPTEAVTSTLFIEIYKLALAQGQGKGAATLSLAVAASTAGLACDGTPWSIFARYISQAFDDQSLANRAWMQNDDLVALPLLAVRDARQSIAKQPDDPLPYVILADAADHFRNVGQVQSTQAIGVRRQGLARVAANEERRQAYEQKVTESYLRLVNYYLTPRFDDLIHAVVRNPNESYVQDLDLAAECLSEALARFRSAPPSDVSPDDVPAAEKQLTEQLKQLQEKVDKERDNFTLGSKGKPLQIQFIFARKLGLTREALRVLTERSTDLDPELAYQLVRMHLLLGQVKDAQDYLDIITEKFDQVPAQFHTRYRMLQIETYIAGGELAKAGKELEKIIGTIREHIEEMPLTLEHAKVGPIVAGFIDSSISPLAQECIGWVWRDSLQPHTIQAWQTLAAYLAERGMVALEEGDNTTARKFLQEAIDIRIYFNGRPIAERYLGLLNRAAKGN